MSQGYVFFGIDQYGESKNIDCAYALSISLKMRDPERETCVVVHKFDNVPKRYEKGFDYIVELPYGRSEVDHHDFRIDWWQIYYATPFEESIYLDTYSLAIDNLSSLWDVTQHEELLFGVARDFRGDLHRNNHLFRTQDNNQMIAFDTRMVYFSKGKKVSEFFKMADPVFKNWRTIYTDLLTNVKVPDFDVTLLVNVVAKLLGEKIIYNDLFDYTDATLKVWEPDEDEVADSWTKYLNVWYADDGMLKLNNHRQTGIFYYDDPTFMNKNIISKLNDNFRKKKRKEKA